MASQLKSNIQPAIKKESIIQSQTLDDPDVLSAITLFKSVIQTSRGPHGSIKVIQNAIGGHMTLTSTSCRLLNVMSFTKPVLRLLVSAAQGHISHYSDGGLFVMLMSLSLIEKSLKFDINYRCLAEIFEQFLAIAQDILEKTLKLPFIISNVNQLSNVTTSILTSKPLCQVQGNNLQFLTNLIIEAFLKTLPTAIDMPSSSDKIMILSVEGTISMNSHIYEGLLIEVPEFPAYACDILKHYFDNNSVEVKTIALVTISMSGDTDQHLGGNYEVTHDVKPSEVVIDHMIQFCEDLVRYNVNILLCQKVVHPRVKNFLRKKQIFVIDRLGLQPIHYVKDLTGATPLLSFSDIPKDQLGQLTSVNHLVIENKSYLHLKNTNSSTITLLLSSSQEESVEELKVLVQTALQTLRYMLCDPNALAGGGCWQTYLSALLKVKVEDQMTELTDSLQCTKSVITSACRIFTESLQTVAMSTSEEGESHMTSETHPHYWRIPHMDNTLHYAMPCSCGQMLKKLDELQFLHENGQTKNATVKPMSDHIDLSRASTILDPYACSVSALRTAVLTANVVLGIGQFIDDKN